MELDITMKNESEFIDFASSADGSEVFLCTTGNPTFKFAVDEKLVTYEVCPELPDADPPKNRQRPVYHNTRVSGWAHNGAHVYTEIASKAKLVKFLESLGVAKDSIKLLKEIKASDLKEVLDVSAEDGGSVTEEILSRSKKIRDEFTFETEHAVLRKITFTCDKKSNYGTGLIYRLESDLSDFYRDRVQSIIQALKDDAKADVYEATIRRR
jgi:hypothetical protein